MVQKVRFLQSVTEKCVAAAPLFLRMLRKNGESQSRNKTGINIAASLHFVAALPTTHYFEYCVEQGDLRKYLTKQTVPVVDGDISVPEEPGLGIELNEEIVSKYRVG
jgi:L-alanine-DL-glutamate epimerase-like enolase superfamily enzyme